MKTEETEERSIPKIFSMISFVCSLYFLMALLKCNHIDLNVVYENFLQVYSLETKFIGYQPIQNPYSVHTEPIQCLYSVYTVCTVSVQ